MPSQRDQARINYKRWYEKNKDLQKSRVKARLRELREWFDEYKMTLHCARCPESDPVCLDFHHLDSKEKDLSVADALRYGWSKERILAEVAKCEVLCSNCHRKEHASLLCRNGAALAL